MERYFEWVEENLTYLQTNFDNPLHWKKPLAWDSSFKFTKVGKAIAETKPKITIVSTISIKVKPLLKLNLGIFLFIIKVGPEKQQVCFD